MQALRILSDVAGAGLLGAESLTAQRPDVRAVAITPDGAAGHAVHGRNGLVRAIDLSTPAPSVSCETRSGTTQAGVSAPASAGVAGGALTVAVEVAASEHWREVAGGLGDTSVDGASILDDGTGFATVTPGGEGTRPVSPRRTSSRRPSGPAGCSHRSPSKTRATSRPRNTPVGFVLTDGYGSTSGMESVT